MNTIGADLISDFQTNDTTLQKYINVVDLISGQEKPVLGLYCNIKKGNTINYSITVLDEELFKRCDINVLQQKIDSFKAECQAKAQEEGMIYIS